MFKVLKHLKPKEWLFVLISLGFVVAQVFLDLRLPVMMREITVLISPPDPITYTSDIWRLGGFMLLATLGSLVCAFVVGFFAAKIGANLSKRLRDEVYSKVQGFSMQEISKFSTASLITRTTNDVTQIKMAIAMGMQILMRAPIMAIWALSEVSGVGWQWTLAIAVAVVFLLLIATFLIIVVLPKFKLVQTLTDKMNAVTRENLEGVRVVRAYNAEAHQEEKFKKTNRSLMGAHLFTARSMAVMMPGIVLMLNGVNLAIFWIGAVLINNAANPLEGAYLFGNMMAFSAFALQIIMSFLMMVMIFVMLPRAQVSAKRINEVLETEGLIKDGSYQGTNDNKLLNTKGSVEFKNVSFRYPDASECVLKDISFKINQGETVAFIGSTGSGKSTLINLVPRFFDVTEGAVEIDGINVKDYTQEALNNKLGYVSQKAILFSGSIKDNIIYGERLEKETEPVKSEEAMLEEIKRAANIAKASEFIEKLENQYDSNVAQGGTNLSGGQKQRLSIARAVYRNPEIYIFDDSFSALDYKTDRELRRALKTETKGATALIVAQRIGTIMDADKIIVLENGQKVGEGTHKELLKDCQVYREIAMSQLSEEELRCN